MDKPKRPRRTVTLCGPHLVPSGKNSGPTRLWAYGYADLARLFGMEETAVRKVVQRGGLDPANLSEVIDFYLNRKPRG